MQKLENESGMLSAAKEKTLKSGFFHIYDQRSFSILSQCISVKADTFAKEISKCLSVNLFDDGCRSVDVLVVPFIFFEAIGYFPFEGIKNTIENELRNKLKLLKQKVKSDENWLVNHFPDLVFEELKRFFLDSTSIEVLVSKAKKQLNWMQKHNKINYVFKEFIDHTLCTPIEKLSEESEESMVCHEHICCYMALEYMQRIDYFQIFEDIFSNVEQRKFEAQKIYHAFFRFFIEYTKMGSNFSFFRAFDKFRRISCMWERESDAGYRVAYLHEGDLLDSYLIHFAICGYHTENGIHKTIFFTNDSPGVTKMRLQYALSVYHWVNNYYFCPINSGIVCCLDENLDIVEKIEVEKLLYQEINEL